MILSASVEGFFVSRMRDFYKDVLNNQRKLVFKFVFFFMNCLFPMNLNRVVKCAQKVIFSLKLFIKNGYVILEKEII